MKIEDYEFLLGRTKKEIILRLGIESNYYPKDIWSYILSRKRWFLINRKLILTFKNHKVYKIELTDII